jgi:hypothetical protein
MSFFRNLFGSSPPPNGQAFLAAIEHYPANPMPFPDSRKTLKDTELDANLDHILSTRVERLTIVAQFMTQFEVDVAPLLDPNENPLPAAQAVDDWLTTALPDRSALPGNDPANAPRDLFLFSDRSGPDILFSLIADLALLEGEAVRLRSDAFRWAIDRDPGNRRLSHYKRPCLFKAGQPDWASTALDLELIMLSIIYERRGQSGILHHFGDSIADFLRGAFDPSPTGFY